MINKFNGIVWATLSLMVFGMTACFDESDEHAVDHDYFPLKDGATWQYVSEMNCSAGCNSFITNWFTFTGEDTIFQGRKYSIQRSLYDISAIIRRDGSRYYMWDIYDNKEYLFLDTSLPEGASRVLKEDDYWKTTYSAGRPQTQMVVKGKIYEDVVSVKRVTVYVDEQYTFKNEEIKYYAAGVGEIYSEQLWTPDAYISDMRLSLLRYDAK